MGIALTKGTNQLAARVTQWFGKSARDLPWRRTRNPYAIWISEIMLQQTQVKTVIPYWERWMGEFPDVTSLAGAGEERVLKLWEGLGYYTRARNLQNAARIICERHGGKFPREFESILALPGIGRYTAGAIASIAYGEVRPILDGNVMRVLARQFAIEGDPKSKANQERLWELSAHLVEAANCASSLNQGLMELGATICTPRDPLCASCPVRKSCAALKWGRVEEFPQVPERKKARPRRFVAYVFRSGERFLVRKRAGGLVNRNLWEFPNFEVLRGQAAAEKTRFSDLPLRPFATIKHTITNNRITLKAKSADVNGEATALAKSLDAEWRTLADLENLPFSSAHGKLRALLMTATEG
jgi:A/G-specific adenine glycosylase